MRKTTTRAVKTKPAVNPVVLESTKMLDSLMNLKDYIVHLENFVDASLCDEIVKEFKNSDEWKQTSVGYGTQNRNIRNTDVIGISTQEIIDKNFVVRKKLDNNLFEFAGKAIKEYNRLFPRCVINQDSGYELLRYKKGQFYIQHTDSYHINPRSVSCSIGLNNDFEGGEFAFFDRTFKYKQSKGSVIMFPSNFMYPHEIMEVTKGTRYSIITWFI